MSFKDRFGITDIDLLNKDQRISFSIDFFEEAIPVVLFVPDKNKRDHDHLHLDKKSLRKFLATLSMKGGSYMNHGYYRIETAHSNEKDCLVDLSIFMFKSSNIQEGIDFLYMISLTKDNLLEIKSWVESFESLSSSQLKEKYNKDLKN